jgi:23S rRNA (cytidine1920-2'-O)/16S rRNA (cytidine1409-2'-O)-methyltransferase
VSFISLRLVLPAIGQLLAEDGEAVVLIKPQFEAGRAAVGRGGLVKDPKVHLRVLQEMVETFKLNGFTVAGMTVSPIHGGDGNIEFLAWLRRTGEDRLPDLQALVRRAHGGQ